MTDNRELVDIFDLANLAQTAVQEVIRLRSEIKRLTSIKENLRAQVDAAEIERDRVQLAGTQNKPYRTATKRKKGVAK